MSKVIINDGDAFLKHLSFWHNKTDDECIELAKDENGNLDAEQGLTNMLERDFCNDVVEELKKIKLWKEHNTHSG